MTTATAKRRTTDKPATGATSPSTIQELIRDALDSPSGILPNANDPERFGADRGRRIAVTRFLSTVVYEDPRLKERRDITQQLLDAVKARLGPEGRDLDAAIGSYESDLIESAAQLAIELDRWVSDMLKLPGAEQMLDDTWNGGGLPEGVVQLILDRVRGIIPFQDLAPR